MKTKPEITDEEIQGYMNFEGLMKELKSKPKKPIVSRPIKIASLIGGIATVAFVAYYIGMNNSVIPEKSLPSKSDPKVALQSPLRNNLPVTGKDSTNQILQKEKIAPQLEGYIKPIDTKKSARSVNSEETKSTANRSDSASVVASIGYVQAEPMAGFSHLYEYFSNELKYPEEAVNDSIQGIVTVSFIITKEGKSENIKVLNSLGQVFDKEVIRLIENMPAWKSATMNNIPVPSKISMPLTFRLERIKK